MYFLTRRMQLRLCGIHLSSVFCNACMHVCIFVRIQLSFYCHWLLLFFFLTHWSFTWSYAKLLLIGWLVLFWTAAVLPILYLFHSVEYSHVSKLLLFFFLLYSTPGLGAVWSFLPGFHSSGFSWYCLVLVDILPFDVFFCLSNLLIFCFTHWG